MLPFKIAYRFLTSNKPQMILILLGIGIGVSVQIFIGSLIGGLQKSLIETTVGSSSQITISSPVKGDTISDYDTLYNKLDKNKDITVTSVVMDYNAFIIDSNYPILLRGFNFNDANKIYEFNNNLIDGVMPKNDNEILIGTSLATDANIKINDLYEIIDVTGNKTIVKVVGIYDLKVTSINNLWIIANLNTVQKIANVNDVITSYEIQVKDVFKADTIAGNIKTDLKVTNWKDQNAQLLSGLSGQSISSIMIQVFVMVSVILGIASVLIISVVQKSKQIGILKAMGIKDREASLVFLYQGLLLGVMGATLGVILGLLLSYSFTMFAVKPDGTPVVALYINYNFIMLSWVIAVIASITASIIPSRTSSKLSPMEVIKNG